MEKVIKLPFKECLEIVFRDSSRREMRAVIHCKTKEIFDKIIDILPEYELRKIDKDYWEEYEEDTIITACSNRVYYGDVNFHKKRGDIVYVPTMKARNW